MQSPYHWEYCPLCDAYFVRCPLCGNNCCNAMYGTVVGKPCPECPATYAYQAAHWDDAPAKTPLDKPVDPW